MRSATPSAASSAPSATRCAPAAAPGVARTDRTRFRLRPRRRRRARRRPCTRHSTERERCAARSVDQAGRRDGHQAVRSAARVPRAAALRPRAPLFKRRGRLLAHPVEFAYGKEQPVGERRAVNGAKHERRFAQASELLTQHGIIERALSMRAPARRHLATTTLSSPPREDRLERRPALPNSRTSRRSRPCASGICTSANDARAVSSRWASALRTTRHPGGMCSRERITWRVIPRASLSVRTDSTVNPRVPAGARSRAVRIQVRRPHTPAFARRWSVRHARTRRPRRVRRRDCPAGCA